MGNSLFACVVGYYRRGHCCSLQESVVLRMILVGIAGRARSGKDTMGTALVHHFGYGAKQYSFANALKCYCRVAGLMTVKDGPLLQLVGTDIYRRKEDEFWIRTACCPFCLPSHRQRRHP